MDLLIILFLVFRRLGVEELLLRRGVVIGSSVEVVVRRGVLEEGGRAGAEALGAVGGGVEADEGLAGAGRRRGRAPGGRARRQRIVTALQQETRAQLELTASDDRFTQSLNTDWVLIARSRASRGLITRAHISNAKGRAYRGDRMARTESGHDCDK